MKIVIDGKIPYIRGVFESGIDADVIYSDKITSKDVKDADAIVVRTRTRCDSALLKGSKVKFIATATIGFDHIDLDYLKRRNIGFSSSAGCNSRGVAQWVLSALSAMKVPVSTLGIVGVGNVGSQLADMAIERGWKVLLNDPPRAKKEASEKFVELDELLSSCEAVSLHVPLDQSTKYLASDTFFEKFRGSCFLNSSRPLVVRDESLIRAIDKGKLSSVAIDVWTGEPEINISLLNKVQIATPHIAGYSKRGKVRATEMAVRAVADYFSIESLKGWTCPEKYIMEQPEDYDILKDDFLLRSFPENFEMIRNNYNYR